MYPNDDLKDLKGAIGCLIQILDGAMEMRKHCIAAAEKYQPDKYVSELIHRIDLFEEL